MKSIGIDIGGTKIAVAVVDDCGRKIAEHTFPTLPANGFPDALDRVYSAIDNVMERSKLTNADIAGIGIGCTGPVDSNRGTVHNPYTLPTWDDCNLIAPLQIRYKTRVLLENDADAAALGEYRFGAGKITISDASTTADPMVMLTFGTGVGFSAIVNGGVYRGVSGAHPELGHIPIRPDGPECYCGIKGCLESITSGTAIQKAGERFGFPSSSDVFRNANAGNSDAIKIIDDVREATAVAAWTIAHTFLPQRIVLGGGIMAEHFELFASHIQKSFSTSTMIPRNSIEILSASLGDAAGVIGAASLVMTKK